MSGLNFESCGSAAITRSRYAAASAVVRTGGTRFGIKIARPKFLAVNGKTALSISPSRTCRCQSSGLRIVMRVVIATAYPIGAAGEAALGAPLLEIFDDRNHAGRIAESEITDHHRTGAGQHIFDDIFDFDDAAATDDWDLHGLGALIDHAHDDRLYSRAGQSAEFVADRRPERVGIDLKPENGVRNDKRIGASAL